jgi:hypothetical protein
MGVVAQSAPPIARSFTFGAQDSLAGGNTFIANIDLAEPGRRTNQLVHVLLWLTAERALQARAWFHYFHWSAGPEPIGFDRPILILGRFFL